MSVVGPAENRALWETKKYKALLMIWKGHMVKLILFSHESTTHISLPHYLPHCLLESEIQALITFYLDFCNEKLLYLQASLLTSNFCTADRGLVLKHRRDPVPP